MLPRRLIKLFGFRVKLMALGGGTFYVWDKENEHLAWANTYQIMAMKSGLFGGVFFPFIHLIQMYLKTKFVDIEEERGEDEEETSKARKLASMIIQFGEIMLVTCVFFLNLIAVRRSDTYMFLMNELLDFNKTIRELIEAGKIELEKEHKRVLFVGEILFHLVMWLSLLLPAFIMITLMHPVEPTHVLIQEWLEIDFKFKIEYVPLLAVLMMSLYGCGTTICQMTLVITLYYIISTVTTDAFTPEQIVKIYNGKRCRLQTKCYGALDDYEVVKLYRTQQILNGLMTQYFGSPFIAFHHYGVMVTTSVLLCFAVRFNDILSEEGPIAYVVIFSCIFACTIMIFVQSRMGGDVAEVGEEFMLIGTNCVPRKFMFRKFITSCKEFYIEVAYPFYHVHNETFLEWSEQVLDFTIELLLW